MKNEYMTPNVEVVQLGEEDVIRTSNELEPMPVEIIF